MLNFSPEVLEQFREAICIPNGLLSFEYEDSAAFKKDAPGGILFQIQAKGYIFHLERSDEGLLNFYHSSPGTSTRVASIELNKLPEFERAFLAFSWNPKEMNFFCGPKIPGVSLVSATGKPSSRQFRVGEDGSIFQIGDKGIKVMEARVFQGGKPVLVPTGIETWHNTLKAIEILWTGKSNEGPLFESVTACLVLSVLVTGLEAYAKKRFAELETEGIKPDVITLFASFSSKAERDSTVYQEIEQDASDNNISVLRKIIEAGKINFQSYDHIKRSYKAAYGIRLGEISISSQVLSDLQRYIEYRHRIVHVSPLLKILNEDKLSNEKPDFANKALSEEAVKCFDEVVQKLHEATLSLKKGKD